MDKAIVQTYGARTPWIIGTKALKSKNLPTALGWQKTMSRLEGLTDAFGEEKLEQLLKEHILCGEKFTKFYQISDGNRVLLSQWAGNVLVQQGPVSEAFPAYASINDVRALSPDESLIAKMSNEDGIALVFTSEMKITVRETISEYEVFSNPEEMRGTYDEVVGLKFKSVQLFNIVWISHTDNFIEVRVDCPKGLPLEALHEIHSLMKGILNKSVGSEVIEEAEDLFPIIESIYESPNEGTIVELGFTTSTGSVKLEKMRRTMTCLREELYHRGGKKELGTKIDPYRISTKWTFLNDGIEYLPELTLAGTSRGVHAAGGSSARQGVSGAFFNNCIGQVDYEHVRDKIIHHLRKVEAEAQAMLAAE